MNARRMIGSLLLMMTVLLAGCHSGRPTVAPPTIVYGEDTCARCHMAIEDARFAAGYVNRAGQTCAFDDLGDFFAWMVAHQDDQALPLWVHDYEDGSWVDGSAAWFVCGSRLHTPMAGAIVALRTHDRALAFSVQHGGKVLDFKGTMEKEHNKS